MASASHLPCIPHIYGTGVALAANLHLITATPNALYAEYDTMINPLRNDLIGGALTPVKGYLRCPDGPGLGVRIDDEIMSRYLVEIK
jgi:L-rhamnonate dehydratase